MVRAIERLRGLLQRLVGRDDPVEALLGAALREAARELFTATPMPVQAGPLA